MGWCWLEAEDRISNWSSVRVLVSCSPAQTPPFARLVHPQQKRSPQSGCDRPPQAAPLAQAAWTAGPAQLQPCICSAVAGVLMGYVAAAHLPRGGASHEAAYAARIALQPVEVAPGRNCLKQAATLLLCLKSWWPAVNLQPKVQNSKATKSLFRQPHCSTSGCVGCCRRIAWRLVNPLRAKSTRLQLMCVNDAISCGLLMREGVACQAGPSNEVHS